MTEREKKAARICAKIQVKAYSRRLKPLECSRWDKMIKIILHERGKKQNEA